MRPSHELAEHTAEVEVRLAAETLDDLLAEAARALGSLLRRGAVARGADFERDVVVRSTDEAALLVDWLNELVFLAETEKWIPSTVGDVRVERIEGADEGSALEARGRVAGRGVDEAPSAVKAATMHGVRVERTDDGVRASVILDV